MITIANKLVLSILFSFVPTIVNNRCCFINAEQHCRNNREQHSTLFIHWQHCSGMITVLLQHRSTNNAVTTCAIFSCDRLHVMSQRSYWWNYKNNLIIASFGFQKHGRENICFLIFVFRCESLLKVANLYIRCHDGGCIYVIHHTKSSWFT